MEVHDIVQEAVIKIIPKKKKCKKAKWLSEEALQIAEKRREVKAKEKRKDRDIKGIFHAKMGTIKDNMVQRQMLRSGKNTQNCTKKHLNDLDNHDGVVTHLEPDILECEVRWALGSITSGGDGIPVELFQTLKDDAVKVLYSVCQQIWKTQKWPQDWKRSVFIPIPRRAMPKNIQTMARFHSSHTLVK